MAGVTIMTTSRKIALGLIAAGVVAALSGCPSPFLSAIKTQIARAPFTGTSYSFSLQWGNPYPQYSFYSPMIIRSDAAGNIYIADSSARMRKYNGSGTQIASYTLKTTSLFQSVNDIAFDVSGNMFVMNPAPEVQEYDANGNFLQSWTYSGFSSPVALAVDGTYVYVVDQSNAAVYKFDYSGNLKATWSSTTNFGGVALNGPNSISTDGSYLYILDAGTNHRVVKIDTSGNYSTSWGGATLYNGTALSSPGGISVAYNTVYVVDTANSRIVGFSTFGSFLSGSTFGSNSTANGFFTSPHSVAVDNTGAIYVTDQGASINGTARVQKFTGVPLSFAAAWTETSAAGGNGVFGHPSALARDADGNIYVADALYSRIEKFDSSGNFILQWGSQGSGQGQFSTGIFAWGMAADSVNNRVYVPDQNNDNVQVFDTSGHFINYLGSNGTNPGQIKGPTAVALDSSGNVYVCNANNFRIDVFHPNGLYANLSWGSAGTGNGQFETPIGVAIDGSGNVWVSDFIGNRIQKFDSMGNFLSVIGSTTTFGSGNGQLYIAGGVAVDQIGNLYVVDLGNSRVQKFDPNGNFMGALGGVGAGKGTFGLPLGIAVTPTGQVAVSDYYTSVVEEFSPTF
jgi:tripartite motif-containing protein 71